MMDVVALIDALDKAGQRDRSQYHLTLGRAIQKLGELAEDLPVVFDWSGEAPSSAFSYRGYYSDLAIDSCDKATVADFLKVCKDALGKTFEGYKGGDFVMTEKTPLWNDTYGSCNGRAIIGLSVTPTAVIIETKLLDE